MLYFWDSCIYILQYSVGGKFGTPSRTFRYLPRTKYETILSHSRRLGYLCMPANADMASVHYMALSGAWSLDQLKKLSWILFDYITVLYRELVWLLYEYCVKQFSYVNLKHYSNIKTNIWHWNDNCLQKCLTQYSYNSLTNSLYSTVI